MSDICTCHLAHFCLDIAWLATALSVLGKFFIGATFTLDWTYTCEVFPTDIRNQGLNLTSSAARISATLASYIAFMVKCIAHKTYFASVCSYINNICISYSNNIFTSI